MLTESAIPGVGEVLIVEGDEAHHALRVKRLEIGDRFAAFDGLGGRAVAILERTEKTGGRSSKGHPGGRGGGWRLLATVETREDLPPPMPRVHLLTGVPKGPRLESLIDAASQAGAHSWAPLECKRSVVDPRPGKLARLERVALEALKQCERPWRLEIRPGLRFESALKRHAPENPSLENPTPENLSAENLADQRCLVIADASGEPFIAERVLGDEPPGDIAILIGPEGGFDPAELDHARRRGLAVCSFGRHTMRIETAAACACATLIHQADLLTHPATTEAPP